MKGQTILITGGSGTFGYAFIRHALAAGAARIVAISRNSEMRYRLEQAYPDPRLLVVPGDVRILSDLKRAFDLVGSVDVVVHAAAEKHISTGQKFGEYTYDVNVHGAENVLAVAWRVPRLIALSTDKACEPVNYYGETKKRAEALFVEANRTVVRYGNVVGSSGSVLPLFLQQRSRGRLTITDRRMTRFFMPIADDGSWTVVVGSDRVMSAVSLVVYAIEEGFGGEIFVPTIPSGTIANLADEIGPGCVIEETGIRDGEKLHEQLVAADEVPRTYRMPDGVYAIYSERQAHLTPVEPTFRHASDVNPMPIRVLVTEAQEAQPCASASLV